MKQLKNFLIKREQSQTRLSFAECEKSRLIAKLTLTLAASGPAMPPAYRSAAILGVRAIPSLCSPLSRRTERSPLGFCTPRETRKMRSLTY